jgi:hypothetical protein
MLKVLLFTIFTVGFVSARLESKKIPIKEDDSPTEKKIIRPWQYCEGCKETVKLYANVTSRRLEKMQRSGVSAFSAVEAHELADLICDDNYLTSFQPFVKYSCIKIMDEHGLKLMKIFEGSFTKDLVTNKAEIFEKKRKVHLLTFVLHIVQYTVKMPPKK